MTLHRSISSRARRSVVTMPVIAGLFVAASQADAAPTPQFDRASPVLETVAARAAVNDGDRYEDRARADRALFTWTGRVDREVLIVVRGRDVRTSGFDAALPNRTRVNSALPRTNANVVVRVNDGRGDVDVIEQPSAQNGYQAVLRVRDPRAGADNYRLTAYVDDRYGRDSRDDVYDRGQRNGDEVYDRRDGDRDEERGNNGNGGGWGRGGRRDGEPFPGKGRGKGRDKDREKDRHDRDGGHNDRGRNDQNGGAGSLNWSGRVDDVVEIQISGRRVDAITRSGVRVSEVNSNMRGGGLPNRNVNLQIEQRSGRGSIAVVQQPSAWNGYTAIIRVNDSRAGAAYYDFVAYWQ
ncbi:hypothetical protein [Gemmatimonas sp.]|uniref:hypothetical protein n=1 Tax=Gemmatimonas sp. TaxID=1962908 RepID=UPI0039836272